MAKRKRITKRFSILEPCSPVSTLSIVAKVSLEQTAVVPGQKGQVFTITPQQAGGLDTNVDYVHHQVTITPSTDHLVIRVGDGIVVEKRTRGLKFSVGPGYNVIPIFDPSTGELGYFKAEIPPAPSSRSRAKSISKK